VWVAASREGAAEILKNRLRREPSSAALGEDPERVPRVAAASREGAAEFFLKKLE
jgi:hypothetical protein